MRAAWLCAALIAAGCAELDESLDEAASELSVSSWSPAVWTHANAGYGAAVATVGSTTIMVRAACCSTPGNQDLAWLQRTPTGWTSSTVIPGQQAAAKVSLAAFNGFIYMVRIGESTNVYISKFNPATSTWSDGTLLPYTSDTTPAIAAFQGQLWLVGNRTDTRQMWTATMTTGEEFSPSTLIANHYTAWPASAAVFNGRLFVAHAQHGTTTPDIVYSNFNGSTWTAEQALPVGTNGARIHAFEPVLAAVNGYLHLIYREPTVMAVRWTYFDRCKWSTSVSIGSQTTTPGYSVSTGGPGLVLITHGGATLDSSEFTAPPTPIQLPTCGIVQP